MRQLARKAEFDAVVFGDFAMNPAPPVSWLPELEDWRSWTGGLPLVFSVGNQRTPVYGGLWRTWDENVRLALLSGGAGR
jgi:hypothetical protein